MQVDLLIQQVVGAVHASLGARDSKRKIGELGDSPRKHDLAFQIGKHGFGIFHFFAPRPGTQFVHILLRFRPSNLPLSMPKAPETSPSQENVHPPAESRPSLSAISAPTSARAAHLQIIPEYLRFVPAAKLGRATQSCLSPFDAGDAALHRQIGSSEMTIHRFQERVAVNRIYVCAVLRYEFYFVTADCYLEVREHSSRPKYRCASERRHTFLWRPAFPRSPPYAPRSARSNVYSPGYRSLARFAFDPYAEFSARRNFPRRLGVVKFQIVLNRISPLNVAENALVHFETQRLLARIVATRTRSPLRRQQFLPRQDWSAAS